MRSGTEADPPGRPFSFLELKREGEVNRIRIKSILLTCEGGVLDTPDRSRVCRIGTAQKLVSNCSELSRPEALLEATEGAGSEPEGAGEAKTISIQASLFRNKRAWSRIIEK